MKYLLIILLFAACRKETKPVVKEDWTASTVYLGFNPEGWELDTSGIKKWQDFTNHGSGTNNFEWEGDGFGGVDDARFGAFYKLDVRSSHLSIAFYRIDIRLPGLPIYSKRPNYLN